MWIPEWCACIPIGLHWCAQLQVFRTLISKQIWVSFYFLATPLANMHRHEQKCSLRRHPPLPTLDLSFTVICSDLLLLTSQYFMQQIYLEFLGYLVTLGNTAVLCSPQFLWSTHYILYMVGNLYLLCIDDKRELRGVVWGQQIAHCRNNTCNPSLLGDGALYIFKTWIYAHMFRNNGYINQITQNTCKTILLCNDFTVKVHLSLLFIHGNCIYIDEKARFPFTCLWL